MEMRPIEVHDLGAAESLLSRGFRERPQGYWRKKLRSLQNYRARVGAGPIGLLFSIKGRDVGVLLTIERALSDGSGAGGQWINLSSWYVEEEARIAAARMLQKATAGNAIYTDLTPSPAVRALNERLGILPIRLGSMLAATPIDALLWSKAVVKNAQSESSGALTPEQRTLLADHTDAGLLTGVLVTATGLQPLIFMRNKVRGVPAARLIYAASRTEIRRHRGAIARYLLSQGIWMLELDANRDEVWPGAVYAPNRAAVFAKGAIDRDVIDHSYSELVFLHST